MSANRVAAAFKAAFAASGEPYGYELSCKLVPGRLLAERFLISIHKDAFLPGGPGAFLASDVTDQVPEAVWQWLAAGLPDADILHFGYEGSDKPVLKIYLEDAGAFAYGLQHDPQGKICVFDALKWNDQLQPVSSQYQCRPELSANQLQALVRRCFTAEQYQAEALAQAWLQRAMQFLPAEQLLMLEVSEPGSPRCSFDLNLYDLEQTVSDWADLIRTTWSVQGLDAAELDAFLQQHGQQQLGHISAGTGRNNEVFFTLYFGVTGIEPGQQS